MIVGCVKEIKKHEYRVGLTPDNVKSYVNNGHTVYIEKDAGIGSGFENNEYEKAGGKICQSADEVWSECEMVVKVKEPLEPEYGKMREGQIIYTYLHLAADQSLTEALLKNKVTGVAYETLKVGNTLPLLKPMSEVAGRVCVQEGAKYLEKHYGGRGVLLGGIVGVSKAKVLILGAGVLGTNAAKMAVGMQADVTIMDINIERLTYIDDIFGGKIKTVFSTDAAIEREIADADLVISSILIPGAGAPKIIKKEYLKKMKKGAVIVDPSIDQGGTSEVSRITYHDDPIFTVDGIILYCVANIPGATPRTSTFGLTNATLKYGLEIANRGINEACKALPELSTAVNTYAGKLTCEAVAKSLCLPYSKF